MDGEANQVSGLSVRGYPSIFFYPGNNKTSTPVSYDRERTVRG